MELENLNIQNKIIRGEIDVNNQELFMSTLVKALIHNLKSQVFLRGKSVEHFILNTGDDIMYLEHKGQDINKDPLGVPNEDYIYTTIPRCIVDLSTIEVLEDQITNPYTRGNFEIEVDDVLHGFNAEYRRVPLKISVSLKYYMDSFTDLLSITQHIISKMLFIRTFKFDYLGQTIQASYKVPTSYQGEKNITFDGGTTESKLRTISLDLDVESNFPVFNERTVIENSNFIKNIETNMFNFNDKIGSINIGIKKDKN